MSIAFSNICLYLGFDKLCGYLCEIHELKISPLNKKSKYLMLINMITSHSLNVISKTL